MSLRIDTHVQVQRVLSPIQSAGQEVTCESFPQMGHSMHGQGSEIFATALIEWEGSLPE